MPSTRSILLVEEDAVCRGFLADNLTADGYDVIVAADKADAIRSLSLAPDLVLCDVNGHTLDLLDAVRGAEGLAARIDPTTPLIVLTRQADALMRVRLFEHGSDDVVRKPFHYGELLARIRAVLRRVHQPPRRRRLRISELEIDLVAQTVLVAGRPVELSGKEYALLVHLAGDPTRVFRKEELLRDVWGYRTPGISRTLDSHAVRLRAKLRAVGQAHWVQNVWGVGYRLAPVGLLERERSAA
jgi:DNA-binding response OmpR family regulator